MCKGIFVGYPEGSKGYKIFVPEKLRVLRCVLGVMLRFFDELCDQSEELQVCEEDEGVGVQQCGKFMVSLW